MLTTYSTLALEYKQQGQESPVFLHTWHRVVLDEGECSGPCFKSNRDLTALAHEIKDLSTSKARAACAIKADCRWAVTGTPIQNRLSELYSLFHFLRLDPYCQKRSFDDTIAKPCIRGDQTGLQALLKLLGFVMLRRPKNVIDLPERHDHRRFLEFNIQERNAYDAAKQRVIECIDDVLDFGSSRDGYMNTLQKISALRTICELGCWPKADSRAVSPNAGALARSPLPWELSTRSSSCEPESDVQPPDDITPWPPEYLSVPGVEPPVSHGQWPTKIQALLQDLHTDSREFKRYVNTYISL